MTTGKGKRRILKFALIGPNRSGTSFIIESIGASTRLLVHGEIFQKDNLDWHLHPEVAGQLNIGLREKAPIDYVRHVYQCSVGRPGVGFKILYGQQDEVLFWVAEQREIRKIFVWRLNLLAHYASTVAAYQTDLWNTRDENEIGSIKVDFDEAAFLEHVEWNTQRTGRVLDILAKNPGSSFICQYRPNSVAEQVREIVGWLGFDLTNLHLSNLKRLSKGPVIERFANPDKVKAVLDRIGKREWQDEE